MIKGKQIPVCSLVAMKLKRIKKEIDELTSKLQLAGLQEQGHCLELLAGQIYDTSNMLETQAKETFRSLRKGF